MLAGMSSCELEYWLGRWQEEFLGDERTDYQIGKLAATIANYSGKTLNEGVWHSALDHMPFHQQPVAEPTQEELTSKINLVFASVKSMHEAQEKRKAKT
jgi:hypothetical protein